MAMPPGQSTHLLDLEALETMKGHSLTAALLQAAELVILGLLVPAAMVSPTSSKRSSRAVPAFTTMSSQGLKP